MLSATTDNERPLIFIIDELDRCRPTFALEVLERIKHFFSVPNVHFVLGVHSGQLENAILSTYGKEIDAGKYLQKFITLRFFLYNHADSEPDRTARKFVRYLVQVMDFHAADRETVDEASSFVADIAVTKEISLRAIERIMTFIAIALAFTPRNHFRHPTLIAGLAILKVVAPELYVKAKRGNLTFREVSDALSLSQWSKQFAAENQRRADWMNGWWRFATEGQADEDFRGALNDLTFRYGIRDGRRIIPFLANDVLDRFLPSEST